MKLPLFLLLSYLTLYVYAYAMAGAYERVLYYYAYKLDCAINGKPRKIAPGCGNDCSFNRFVQYIDKKDIALPAITNDEFPDPDTAARRIYELGLTGPYILNSIAPQANLKKDDIPGLLKYVSEFMEYSRQKSPDKILVKGIRTAANRVLFFRRYATSTAVEEKVKVEWETYTRMLRYSDESTETFRFIDIQKTAQMLKKSAPDLMKQVRSAIDAKHQGNVESAKLIVKATHNNC